LGQPLRFWHMLVNTTPGEPGPSFKYWSPISVGSWVLLLYSIFAFVSFVEALRNRSTRAGAAVLTFNVIGSVLALFIASYTGVVLSVSNQPVWSDTWTLGALFLASALSGSAALLSWFAESRSESNGTKWRLLEADGYFALLELALIAMFFLTLASAGTLSVALAGPWSIIWILVLASLFLPIGALVRSRRTYDRTADAVKRISPSGSLALIVIAGIFLMRLAIIFSAQS
jgi:formate-dependent nitrite reductase membrane component NrfD